MISLQAPVALSAMFGLDRGEARVAALTPTDFAVIFAELAVPLLQIKCSVAASIALDDDGLTAERIFFCQPDLFSKQLCERV